MPRTRILCAWLIGAIFVASCFLLVYGGNADTMLFLNPPTYVFFAGGILSALILANRKNFSFSLRLISAMNDSLPFLTLLMIAVGFARVCVSLDRPEDIGPNVIGMMAPIPTAAALLVFVVFPLRFRYKFDPKMTEVLATQAEDPVNDHAERVGPPIAIGRLERPTYSSKLRYVLGAFTLIMGLLTGLVLKHATDLIMAIIMSPPTLVIFLGFLTSAILIGSPLGTFRLLLKYLLARPALSEQEAINIQRMIASLKNANFFAMIVCLSAGIMKVMANLDLPEIIGPGLMIASVSIFYGIIIYSLLILPLEYRFQYLTSKNFGDHK